MPSVLSVLALQLPLRAGAAALAAPLASLRDPAGATSSARPTATQLIGGLGDSERALRGSILRCWSPNFRI